MKIFALLTMIFFAINSSHAQTKTFKSNLFPVTFSLSEEWTAEDKEEYKKIILNHKQWGRVLIERVEGASIEQVYSFVKRREFADSTGKVLEWIDLKEGETTVNGKTAKYMIGTAKNGNETNGAWTYLHYFIKNSDTESYYFNTTIRANAKEKFLTAINSFVIL